MDISAQVLFPFLCFLLSCLFIFATVKSRRSSAAVPPGPPRWPIIGNILDVGRNPHISLTDLSRTYGPVMSLKLGTLTTVVVSSPEAAREVLQTHDHVLSARTFTEPVRATGHDVVSMVWLPPSAPWRLLRKISATHMFSPQRLRAAESVRMKKVQELVSFMAQSSEKGEAVDMARASFVTVLNIISNSLVSVDFASYGSRGSHEQHDMIVRIMEALGRPDIANFLPFLGFLDLQGNQREWKTCTDWFLKAFQGLIDARSAERSNRTGREDVSATDLLDALLDLAREDGTELSMRAIKCMLLDLLGAGTDTTASTVEWAMAELLRKPETMAKAQAEIRGVIGGNSSLIQEHDVEKLPYLRAAVKETLRLHPPVPFLVPRKAMSDARIHGFLVPKNAQVLVNVWAIGRDPSVWENPRQFEPERFLGREIDVKGQDFELTPFGSGRRICPGMSLAIKTVPMMLASLLHHFDWKLQDQAMDMEEAFGLTLHKAKPLYALPVKKKTRDI